MSHRDEAKNEEGIRIIFKCNEAGLVGSVRTWIGIFLGLKNIFEDFR